MSCETHPQNNNQALISNEHTFNVPRTTCSLSGLTSVWRLISFHADLHQSGIRTEVGSFCSKLTELHLVHSCWFLNAKENTTMTCWQSDWTTVCFGGGLITNVGGRWSMCARFSAVWAFYLELCLEHLAAGAAVLLHLLLSPCSAELHHFTQKENLNRIGVSIFLLFKTQHVQKINKIK